MRTGEGGGPVRFLMALAGLVGVGILVLTWVILEPIVRGQITAPPEEQRVTVPAYDYEPWHSLPVLYEGRIKPFESAAAEIVSTITGRSRFEGKDAVAVVLQWKMLRGSGDGKLSVDWEKYPFILCDHRPLRHLIYLDQVEAEAELTAAQLEGKYVSPEDLRRSEAFKRLLEQAEEIRERDSEKATQLMSPEQRKAEEVAGRLRLFDSVSQNNPPIWGGAGKRPQHYPDPLLLVALDRVPGAAWFSPAELRRCQEDASAWRKVMQERLDRTPQLYINPERRKTLEQFQEAVKAGTAQKTLDELAGILRERTARRVAEFERGLRTNDPNAPQLETLLTTEKDRQEFNARLMPLIHGGEKDPAKIHEAAVSAMRGLLARHDEDVIADLRVRIPPPGTPYHPADLRYRMLHLSYLESRYPDLYVDSAAWQKFPASEAERVIQCYDHLAQAYRSGDADAFARTSSDFLTTVRDVSERTDVYPGADTVSSRLAGLFGGAQPAAPGWQLLDLERLFNRVQPFRWAWVIMLGGMLAFALSLALASTAWYRLGWAAYLASVGFQLFGFFCRIVIAGRPPVSDMYETVIWVAFMSSVFATILEAAYRRKVIILAGAMAATLGLVLADQLPLVLDSKIQALQPVLRSNYWLTIHVLTIVSSYAAGTVAWALGNIALGMIVFGRGRRPDVIKTLSLFTYKAMQIAVLLLAAGTFLGGWWAAESWGRFWGWDPKEVWALIALVCYVIPLHARYIGWVKDFGLAASAVLCYAAIVMSWYGVNFVLGAGLHSYGFGGGGPWWVFWAGLLNVEWVLAASVIRFGRPRPMPVAETVAAGVAEPV